MVGYVGTLLCYNNVFASDRDTVLIVPDVYDFSVSFSPIIARTP